MDTDRRRLEQMGKPVAGQDPETYTVIGAAMEVHNTLGRGFLEAVYQAALAVELTARNVPFEREKLLPIQYKNAIMAVTYKVDFICFGSLLVECKALPSIGGVEQAQVLNYLKATGLTRGLLLNFGSRVLEYKRVAFSSGVELAEGSKDKDILL